MAKTMFLFSMILFLAIVVSPLAGTDSTSTIDTATLTSIRSAIITDPLILRYWNYYSRTTRDDEVEPPYSGDRAFTNSFGLESKAILLYQRVIRNDMPADGGSTSINNIRNDFYLFPWHTYQLAIHHPFINGDIPPTPEAGETIPSDWDVSQSPTDRRTWYNLNSYDRGRELSYNLIFMAFMIDMLYYSNDTPEHYAEMGSIISNFNVHLTWIVENFLDYDNWNGLGWKVNATEIQPMGLCCDWFGDSDDDNPYCMPSIGNDVNRYVLTCGLGYGAIVTRIICPQNVDFDNSDSLINFVKNEFVSSIELPAGSGCYGMNDYIVTKTGMYVGGITYQNRLLYLTPLFLTALNRVYGINLYNSSNAWNCDLVPKMVKNVLVRIDPGLQHILQEDDWRYDGINEAGVYAPPPYKANHSVQIERGLLPFYFQNTDEADTRENIRWYVKRLKENNSNVYPREAWEHDFKSSFMVVMSYRAGADDITGAAAVPEHYINRNYTNGELTILRSPLANSVQSYPTSDFKDMNMMTINHENSFTFAHKNDDKTAYQLYLDGKPIIIEGGYRPADSWKEWFRNASSHNLLLINPGFPTTGSDSEDDYLGIAFESAEMKNAKIQFEDPSSPIIYGLWQSYRDNPELFKPARKEYLFSNNDISHLKVSVRYRNNVSSSGYSHNNLSPQTGDYPCQVERNFYSVADKYYLVMDRVHQEVENPDGNVYKNQLHFLDDSPGGYLMTAESDRIGVYKYYYPSNSLLIAMGSSVGGDHYCVRDSLPLGWREWDYQIGKMQLRLSYTTSASTNAEDHFLTLLFPSNAVIPCTITETVNNPGSYGIVAQRLGSTITSAITSNGGISYPSNNLRVMTNSKFFVVEANPTFNSINNLILHKGNSIEVQDISGTRFENKHIFSSESDQFDEIIANWVDSSLIVTIRAANPTSPKYKILRCGVLAENFHSSTEFGSEAISIADTSTCARGTIQNNIQSLAYDDEYFYVNYSWDDLLAAGMINDDLVIAKATIPESIINTDLNIQGTVVIDGDITIAIGASMELYPNSTVLVSDGFGIHNHGDLIISGGTARSVLISNGNQQWDGITTYRDGSLICSGAVIESAKTGVQIRGASTVNNSEIRNCYYGIAIDTGTSFLLEGNTIRLNSYAIIVANNYITSELGCIQGNEIYHNGVGMLLYNSNTKLAANDILNNTRAGLYLLRGSEPIVNECNISYTESGGQPRPEIMLESESYPIIDDAHNDFNVDGVGPAMFYDYIGKIKPLVARNNFWGSTNSVNIRHSIYPLDWEVKFEPFSMVPNTSMTYLNDTLFKQAITAEDSGDLNLAKQLYTSIVATEPDSLYALQSLGRLNSIYSGTPALLSELRAIYDTYIVSCSDSILLKSARIKSIMLDRFDGLYLDALQGYEDQLQISTTELDSLLCLLDIAYTLQDMYYDDQGKGSHTAASYHANGLHVSSLKDAKQSVDQLWGQILNRPGHPGLLDVPVPTKLELSNYPNPFNPSTTVAFSLPAEGIVRLSVYNIRGQLVRELINGSMPRGFHKVVWDGRDNGNRSVSSGLYYVRIESGKTSTARKMLLLK